MVQLLWAAIALLSGAQVTGVVAQQDAVLGSDPTGPLVDEFQIANNTDRAVTAWNVVVEATLSDGRTTSKSLSSDAYASYARGSGNEGKFIRPHASLRASVPLDVANGLTVTRIQSSVKWAIFADGSWTGDAAEVRRMFERRAQNKQTFAFIVSALRAGLATGRGSESLQVALDRMNTPDQDDADNPHKAVMRRNLEQALKGRFAPLPANELLRRWILDSEALWTAADEHRRSRAEVSGKSGNRWLPAE
jgi:hypothetical protein